MDVFKIINETYTIALQDEMLNKLTKINLIWREGYLLGMTLMQFTMIMAMILVNPTNTAPHCLNPNVS